MASSMVRRALTAVFVCVWLAGCGSVRSSVKPDAKAKAKATPAERFASEQKRRQQEAEERQRREEFMNRMNARTR